MIIQTDAQTREFCADIAHASAIFLDTEFVSEGRYYPDLGTIQIGAGEHIALIDPLAVKDLSPLQALFTDPGIEKVFHAAEQDLMIFFRLFGEPVTPIFDAQVAAALLGYGEQLSFANLVERVTGTHLQKAHSFTDWLRRPLSSGQVEYALDDVRYLQPVYDHLLRELAQRGRLEWAREEFVPAGQAARYQPANPEELYLRVRGVERMNVASQARLRELMAWREITARERNIPVGRIGRDEVLQEVARRPRESVRELKEIRGMQPQQADRFGAEMIEVARCAEPAPKLPSARYTPLPTAMEPTVDFLTLCLRSLAEEQELSPGLVANRSDLTALVLFGAKADVPLMRGWRRELVGNALLATLQGHATARILPGTRRVHLDWHEEAAALREEALSR
ncbi:MAG: ribonuclease D [Armatimonadota bacterium]